MCPCGLCVCACLCVRKTKDRPMRQSGVSEPCGSIHSAILEGFTHCISRAEQWRKGGVRASFFFFFFLLLFFLLKMGDFTWAWAAFLTFRLFRPPFFLS